MDAFAAHRHPTGIVIMGVTVLMLILACTCRLPSVVVASPTPYPTYTPYDTYTPPPTAAQPTEPPPTATVPPTVTNTPKPPNTKTPTATQFMLVLTVFIPIFPTHDLVLEDVFLSTQGEVIARVANAPAGGFDGSVTYQVYADGVLVATRSETIPHGSQVFWSGYKVIGQQTIRVVLDSAGAYWEASEANNEMVKTCSGPATACW